MSRTVEGEHGILKNPTKTFISSAGRETGRKFALMGPPKTGTGQREPHNIYDGAILEW